MDIKKILIADEVDPKIVSKLLVAGLQVDVNSDITIHKILDIIKVSRVEQMAHKHYVTQSVIQNNSN